MLFKENIYLKEKFHFTEKDKAKFKEDLRISKSS